MVGGPNSGWHSAKALKGVQKAYLGTEPDISHFRVFGCNAYAHVPKKDREKLDPTSQKMAFVGYNPLSTDYCLYDARCQEVCVSRDITFDE